MQDVLEKHASPNAHAIFSCLVEELENDNLPVTSLTGFSSDGAAVMVGKKADVVTRLKQKTPPMLAIHCICHTLALACADANESLKPIKNAETILRQLWQYFENSPKRATPFLKLQLAVRGLHVPEEQLPTVGRKLKKACRTRWLSFDSAV